MKKSYWGLFWRLFYLILALLLQVVLIVLSLVYLERSFPYFYLFTVGAGLLLSHIVVATDNDPAYKIAWLIPLLAFPVLGLLLYVFFGRESFGSRRLLRFRKVEEERLLLMNRKDAEALEEAEGKDAYLLSRFIAKASGCPPFRQTQNRYFPTGESLFEAMLSAVEKAERFVFLEFFIIGEGQLWERLVALLEEKVKDGVEVRVIYDGIGSLTRLSPGYEKKLREKGIGCRVFNPAFPFFSAALSKRDHRKILVVDGRVGFTGGANLADEYINAGSGGIHWKDAGLLIEGEAVRSLTAMFLSMWHFFGKDKEDTSRFFPDRDGSAASGITPSSGWVQPYCDTPLEGAGVGAGVLRQLIGRASESIYIMTPYLILDSTTENLLLASAGCGLDVRIITPGVGDKAWVHTMTRSFYRRLLAGGVRIFEYTPGFIHSKVIFVDKRLASVGSINLDFRSFYLQFECAVLLGNTDCLSEIGRDFEETFSRAREIGPADCRSVPLPAALCRFFLRPYIPLL